MISFSLNQALYTINSVSVLSAIKNNSKSMSLCTKSKCITLIYYLNYHIKWYILLLLETLLTKLLIVNHLKVHTFFIESQNDLYGVSIISLMNILSQYSGSFLLYIYLQFNSYNF